MKKVIITVLIVLAVAAVGVGAYHFHQKNKLTESNNSTQTSDANAGNTNQVLTSPDDIGFLSPTPDGKAQIYTNNNLGIVMTVPKNWVLVGTMTRDSVSFKDPVDAETYYNEHRQDFINAGFDDNSARAWINGYVALDIDFFNNFQSWLKSEPRARDCNMIKECFQKDSEVSTSDIMVNSYPAVEVVAIAGEESDAEIYIEHNGIYRLSMHDVVLGGFNKNNLKFIK